MSDIFDSVGTATEGGLLSRALEPDSGAKSPHPHQPERCLNCDTVLTGAYCHACGQQGHLHRTIGAFMHDLLHGALHFEGKLWHTLPLLVFRPGRLTRRYIEGQRARFVSPMALFLFGVFLMFAVFQMVGLTAPTDLSNDAVLEETLGEARGAANAEIATIEEQLASADLSEQERTEAQERLAFLREYLADDPSADQSAMRSFAEGFIEGASGTETQEPGAPGNPAPADTTPAENVAEPVVRADLSDLETGETGIAFIDSAVAKWSDNPGLMLYKLQANAYKFSWMLIPISIPFVWLLFAWKRRFKAYDHAIFITYSLSFVTLLFITVSILGAIGVASWIPTAMALLIPPIHLYKQIRYTYDLSRFSAFWRLLVLSAFIWIVVGLFIQLLLVLGAF
ncbi:DUF3667 domain-containing protein [Aurantiacibacter odishensis]|uniref:DUF3667 domain-containing protein n=1 Tax=Aurantiacibacter odishensis TaxID=1155476 RepID=UPI000E762D50|nr:DUF3667 domain-containing protein [Aurantiacibacter odishensis]